MAGTAAGSHPGTCKELPGSADLVVQGSHWEVTLGGVGRGPSSPKPLSLSASAPRAQKGTLYKERGGGGRRSWENETQETFCPDTVTLQQGTLSAGRKTSANKQSVGGAHSPTAWKVTESSTFRLRRLAHQACACSLDAAEPGHSPLAGAPRPRRRQEWLVCLLVRSGGGAATDRTAGQ